jgi:hypothetical protein
VRDTDSTEWQPMLDECDLELLPKTERSGDRHPHNGKFSPEWENGAFIGNGMSGAMIYT